MAYRLHRADRLCTRTITQALYQDHHSTSKDFYREMREVIAVVVAPDGPGAIRLIVDNVWFVDPNTSIPHRATAYRREINAENSYYVPHQPNMCLTTLTTA